MKKFSTFLTISALAAATAAQAQVSLSNNGVGSATAFPTTGISGTGTLSFNSLSASPAGGTIAGGQAGQTIASGTGIGETFNYTGSAATLSAISIIDTGAGGGGTYQPFLFDLGTALFNTPSSQFNPSAQTDLFTSAGITSPAFGSKNFLEFDFTGADAVTLQTGHTYAFGLLSTSATSDLGLERASGTQSDPNGDGFTLPSLSATADNAAPFSGSVRNVFIGVYTVTATPEPSSFALLGMGALAGMSFLRRRK